MPALTIPPDDTSPPSPVRPPMSPLTPPPSFTHSQPDQTAIPPPPPAPIFLEANTDAIALRAAISALQVQKMRAARDIQDLSRAKDEALSHPEEFARDLWAGKVKPSSSSSSAAAAAGGRAWNNLPGPQDVIRCPPINWSQYAIVGSSLDKLHAEQVATPTQGTPATIGPAGVYEFKAGEGNREMYKGVAEAYSPLRDRIDKKPRRR